VIWYVLLGFAAAIYNFLYLGHCVRIKRYLGAVGAAMLGTLPILLGIILLTYY